MSVRSSLATGGLVVALLLMTTSVALAWPDEPPDYVLISGPGLAGTMKITDAGQLAAFKLGALEDFEQGVLAAPPQVSGGAYQITRYFYGGTFNFAGLRYYPDPAGGAGYLYFEDGPDLTGDHTPFNRHWLRARPEGEAALQQALTEIAPGAEGPQVLSAPTAAPLPLTLMAVVVAIFATAWVALRRPRAVSQPAGD